ncbi:hypothetical protein F4778DRAFT_782912 [Xylariomycetidae sp. FL2044]|nr:hypothetical protein F4778DRAFT_782912 [Xylariomycetidae sp. FL2044]
MREQNSWFQASRAHGDVYQSVQQSDQESELSKHTLYTASEPLPPYSYSLEPEPRVRSRTALLWDRYFNNGWRGEMIRIAGFSTFLWLANVSVYILYFAKYNTKEGSGILMSGSCNRIQWANTLIHAALNIMTSLMLAASTLAMESLCCPTREEVDEAHAQRRWLGIGGLSLRNFRFINRSRSILWILLWLTSVPLHLFFNAVFYSSSHSYQYSVAVVSKDFFSDTDWKPTADNSSPSNFADLGGYSDRAYFERPDNDTILALLNDSRGPDVNLQFASVNASQCMQMYNSGFRGATSDVVVITTSESNTSSSPLIWSRWPERSLSSNRVDSNKDSYDWICHDYLQDHPPIADDDGEIKPDKYYCTTKIVEEIADDPDPWTVYGGQVESCIYRPQTEQCSLLFNVWMMLAVLVCGFIKTVIIFWICIRYSRSRNLRSFGDAVASFLEREDGTTKGLALVPSKVFVERGLVPWDPQRYSGQRQRWLVSAGVKQFWITLGITMVYALTLGGLLAYAIVNAADTAFDFGFGQTNIQSLAQFEKDDVGSSGIVPNILVSNVPQVFFSILYLAYNDLYSKIHMAADFNEHSKRAMGLRVTEKPRGAQLETHFFHLPIHWALPVMGTSSLLHWLTSQGLFPVRIDGVNNAGVVDPDDQLSRLGYNSRAIASIVGIMVLIAVVTAGLCWFRKFDVGLGEAGNSLVISSACHPPRGWNATGDMSAREVSWGDVPSDEFRAREGIRHCSFAPTPPRNLLIGAYYN